MTSDRDLPLEGVEGWMSRLRRASLLPRKSLGQHFLHNPSLLRAIVEAAELPEGATVLEVGCGPGTLTREIARVAGQVLCVEVDARMAAFAQAELRGVEGVEWLVEDALDGKGGLHPRLREALDGLGEFYWISNLPYAVATPLITSVLESDLPWRRAVLTVQWEVAERLCAAQPEGSGRRSRRAYGPLSLLVACRAHAEIVRKVPPGAFLPPPRVDSGVVVLEPLEEPPVRDGREYEALRYWSQALFGSRRKQIGGLLRQRLGHGRAAEVLAAAGWPPERRAEDLELGDFLLLAREFPPETF